MTYVIGKTSNNLDEYNTESNFRWYYAKYYDEDYDDVIYGIPQFPSDLPRSDIDIIYEVDASDVGRIDIVAEKFYKSKYKDLIWVIMLYNNIEDPVEELIVGKKLYIPDITTIQGTLI